MPSNNQDRYIINKADAQKTHEQYYSHLWSCLAYKGQYTPILAYDGISKMLQDKGVDVVFTHAQTRKPVYCDEKADSHEPDNFCLEEFSNTKSAPWKQGWMAHSLADWICYGFLYLLGIVDVFMLNFPQLRDWFWPNHENHRKHDMTNTTNCTRSRIIPVKEVLNNVYAVHYLISQDGTVAKIPLLANARDCTNKGSILRKEDVRILKEGKGNITIFPAQEKSA